MNRSVINRQTGWRDRRSPDETRIDHSINVLAVGDELSVVTDAERSAGPAVTLPRRQLVDFIPAARAMLVLPNRSGCRVVSQALRIAMAERPNLRRVAAAANERIVGWRLAVT